ncbi:hypothetical protein [Plantactinospora sonchi]|uniref:Uncharacterized protein n=1 Tax=Plantactinospora sonchi TaxID=1544735 RepID=A0ABU7RWL4_9ACTN
MASFAEYAALARHLHDLHRAGAQADARLAEQRGSAGAVADRLDQRLAAQQHRLAAIGQAIGASMPPPAPVGPPAPFGPPGPPPPSPSAPVSGQPTPPAPRQPTRGGGYAPPAPHTPPGHVAPAAGGTPYPELAANPARRALPSVSGADHGGHVPGQRAPADPAPTAVSAGWSADPHRDLELARQAADGADAIIVQVETMAQQPPLLPTLSPLRRAFAVYGSCAAVLAITIWIILTVVEFRTATSSFDKAASAFGVFAWSCAGLPAMAFFIGYTVLNLWGKPRIVAGRPAAYARLGFLICFLASPVAFLMYYFVAG